MASTEAQKRASTNYNKKQDNIMVRPTKEEGQRIREAAKAAGLSVQGYVLQAVRAYMEQEGAGAAVTPQEPSQCPTETVSPSKDITTPQQQETPQRDVQAVGGCIRDAGSEPEDSFDTVASPPTQPPKKSTYTFADFEAMDDTAFQRFVKMSSMEFSNSLRGLSMTEVAKVTARRERAQRKEAQRKKMGY